MKLNCVVLRLCMPSSANFRKILILRKSVIQCCRSAVNLDDETQSYGDTMYFEPVYVCENRFNHSSNVNSRWEIIPSQFSVDVVFAKSDGLFSWISDALNLFIQFIFVIFPGIGLGDFDAMNWFWFSQTWPDFIINQLVLRKLKILNEVHSPSFESNSPSTMLIIRGGCFPSHEHAYCFSF